MSSSTSATTSATSETRKVRGMINKPSPFMNQLLVLAIKSLGSYNFRSFFGELTSADSGMLSEFYAENPGGLGDMTGADFLKLDQQQLDDSGLNSKGKQSMCRLLGILRNSSLVYNGIFASLDDILSLALPEVPITVTTAPVPLSAQVTAQVTIPAPVPAPVPALVSTPSQAPTPVSVTVSTPTIVSAPVMTQAPIQIKNETPVIFIDLDDIPDSTGILNATTSTATAPTVTKDLRVPDTPTVTTPKTVTSTAVTPTVTPKTSSTVATPKVIVARTITAPKIVLAPCAPQKTADTPSATPKIVTTPTAATPIITSKTVTAPTAATPSDAIKTTPTIRPVVPIVPLKSAPKITVVPPKRVVSDGDHDSNNYDYDDDMHSPSLSDDDAPIKRPSNAKNGTTSKKKVSFKSTATPRNTPPVRKTQPVVDDQSSDESSEGSSSNSDSDSGSDSYHGESDDNESDPDEGKGVIPETFDLEIDMNERHRHPGIVTKQRSRAQSTDSTSSSASCATDNRRDTAAVPVFDKDTTTRWTQMISSGATEQRQQVFSELVKLLFDKSCTTKTNILTDFTCFMCPDRRFYCTTRLREHIITHHCRISNPLKCNVEGCTFTGRTLKVINTHRTTTHHLSYSQSKDIFFHLSSAERYPYTLSPKDCVAFMLSSTASTREYQNGMCNLIIEKKKGSSSTSTPAPSLQPASTSASTSVPSQATPDSTEPKQKKQKTDHSPSATLAEKSIPAPALPPASTPTSIPMDTSSHDAAISLTTLRKSPSPPKTNPSSTTSSSPSPPPSGSPTTASMMPPTFPVLKSAAQKRVRDPDTTASQSTTTTLNPLSGNIRQDGRSIYTNFEDDTSSSSSSSSLESDSALKVLQTIPKINKTTSAK